MILKATKLVALFTFALLVASRASAAPIVLDFEHVNATYPSGFAFVQNFYNGGTSSDGTSGTNFGVAFSSNAQAICLNTIGVSCSNTSRGGLGSPTSQLGGLFFLSGAQTFMNVAAGFDTGFSFFYAAINQTGSVSVFDGLNGTGTLLATLNLATTPSGPCPGFNAGFCPFFPSGIGFSGIARSVSFAGVADQIVFDDVTFGSVTPGETPIPEPATIALLTTGLVGGAVRRYRNRRNA
jgi:PEP-CTERM motif-containing protein